MSRYIINDAEEIVIDTEDNYEWSFDNIESKYEEVFYDYYPDDECEEESVKFALECLLNQIREGQCTDIEDAIFNMVC